MKVSERIYKSVEEVWNSYNTHPFVTGIGDGSLDMEKFRFYMVQDYVYLLDYAKVFALGVVKSKKDKHMRMFANLVDGILNCETSTHITYMGALGISEEEISNAKASLVTESYTKYMLAVAHDEGIAEIAAAVLACSWSYKCIGDNIVKVYGKSENEFYGPWIETYSNDNYDIENNKIIDLVNELTADYTEEQIENIIQIVINCSRYEYMFWDMSWNKEM